MSQLLHEYYRTAKDILRQGRIESADIDARLLIQNALNLTQEDFYLKADHPLTDIDIENLDVLIKRRLQHEPVSRIIGRRGFWKSEFKISPATLDPRPDSETLIETVLEYVPPAESILDLGTGSGCLLLSLLQEWPIAHGVGIDISSAAINIARENAEELQLRERASFFTVNWNNFLPEHKFDVVISNPPYITSGEIPGLEPEVRLYDPKTALDGGTFGLEAYCAIIDNLRRFVHQDSWIFFEIGSKQAAEVAEQLENADFRVLDVRRDLGGLDRVIVVRP